MKKKPPIKKPRRTGVAVQFYLSQDLHELLEAYQAAFLAEHGVHISKTDFFERATRNELKAKGYSS